MEPPVGERVRGDPGAPATEWLEAKRSQLDIGPVDGPTITKTLSGLYDLKPATVAKLKDILLAKKK